MKESDATTINTTDCCNINNDETFKAIYQIKIHSSTEVYMSKEIKKVNF